MDEVMSDFMKYLEDCFDETFTHTNVDHLIKERIFRAGWESGVDAALKRIACARETKSYLITKIRHLTEQNIRYENALRAITESGVVDCLECRSHERDALEALRKKP